MTEPEQEPVSWHYVWLRVLTQAHQHGRTMPQTTATRNKTRDEDERR